MHIHVVGTYRCGGTAYAHNISEQYNVKFLNEPWKAKYIRNADNYGVTKFSKPEDVHGDFVCHHIVNQYIHHRGMTVAENDQLILIERKNKWLQLISWIVECSLARKYYFHNIDYAQEKITVDEISITRMFDQWSLFNNFKTTMNAKYTDIRTVYYEDLNIVSSLYRKNTGYENVEILNLDWVREQYDIYMKNNSDEHTRNS